MSLTHCLRCREPLKRPSRRRKYCGEECAEIALREQLAALTESRRKARPIRLRVCEVCRREFNPRTRAKYCGDECRKVGLGRAIARQTQRRELEKSRAQGRKPGSKSS